MVVIPSEGTTCLLSSLDLNDSNTIAHRESHKSDHFMDTLTLRCTRVIEKVLRTYKNSTAEESIRKFVHVYCQHMRVRFSIRTP